MHEKFENIRQNNWKLTGVHVDADHELRGNVLLSWTVAAIWRHFRLTRQTVLLGTQSEKMKKKWLNDWHLAYSSAHLFPWQIFLTKSLFLTWQTITWVLTRKKFKRFSTFGAHKLITKLRKKIVKCLHFLFNSDEKKNRA